MRGQEVQVIDKPDAFRATSTAAGIINPVTGKRFALSWRFSDFFPVANTFYKSLEQALDIQIWHDRIITRIVQQQADLNSWISRSGYPEMSEIMSTQADAGAWKPVLNDFLAFGKLNSAAQVNIPLLCSAWKARGLAEGWFQEREFDHTTLPQHAQQYDGIVFATGHLASQSGLFTDVPWNHAKGTVAHVKIKALQPDTTLPLLKDKILLAPLLHQPGVFWAGSNYEWKQTDAWPTATGVDMLAQELQSMLRTEYEITEVKSGIRPVAIDRRPVLGASQTHRNVFIFNGLGAKGALLAPFWAQHLVEHLLDGAALDKEVDVRRFEKAPTSMAL
jgi:glycine oxidase